MRSLKEMLKNTSKKEETRATLCSAIGSRQVIEFYYHGGYRRVEPYCLGLIIDANADNESLLCYQTGGFSELQEAEGWKLYRASDMEEIEVSGEQFGGSRPGYNPDNVKMEVVRCRVTPGGAAAGVPVAGSYVKPGKLETENLTHNELMRRFRFTHPVPIPELNTYMFSGPANKRLPERTEWENKHFAGLSEELYLMEQTA